MEGRSLSQPSAFAYQKRSRRSSPNSPFDPSRLVNNSFGRLSTVVLTALKSATMAADDTVEAPYVVHRGRSHCLLARMGADQQQLHNSSNLQAFYPSRKWFANHPEAPEQIPLPTHRSKIRERRWACLLACASAAPF